ncbi:MAG: STAS domain-containing protein [Anaerolineae bacterium]|nr:STAS domain-containing protein [Anaerolineae bacterium]
MAFDVSLEMTKNGVAKITLAGELDANVAGEFRDKVDEAAQKGAKRLVLLMADLEYMASAGLRSLIFAKQKMGADVDIYVIAAQDPVMDTMEMTGFHHSVIMRDEYDAEIENI